MFCKKCGKEILNEAVVCVHCGCSTQESKTAAAVNDAPSAGMAVLGFFIPLAGLIVWLINRETKPLMAKSAGKGALIGFVFPLAAGIILSAVLFVLYGVVMFG